jgi:hypothetical protein
LVESDPFAVPHNTYAAASIAAAETTKTKAMSTTAHMYLSRSFVTEGAPFGTGSRAIGVLTETFGSVTSLDEFSASIPNGVSDFDCSTPSACVASGASCD